MWEVILIVLTILFGLAAAAMTFVAYKFNQKVNDLERFIIEFNNDINGFKSSIDRITNSNIMVYDEVFFDVMTQCKNVKSRLDSYLTKYDEYKQYIYTEDVDTENTEQSFLGVVRPGANRGPE